MNTRVKAIKLCRMFIFGAFILLSTLIVRIAYITAYASTDVNWYIGYESETEYNISTADELAGLALLVNSGIDFAGKTINLVSDISLSKYGVSFNDGKGWIPIGNNSNPFRGNFDGKGNKISAIYIYNLVDYTGLFGKIGDGSIKNLGVENINITGYQYVGGIAGLVTNGSVINCYSTGTVSGFYEKKGQNFGGIVGQLINNALISQCYSSCDINAYASFFVGGIVGMATSYSTIIDCYTNGDIKRERNPILSDYYIGGIAGRISTGSSLMNCYATGEITGARYVGGIVGYLSANINYPEQYCYFSNAVALNPNFKAYDDFEGRVAGDISETHYDSIYAFAGLKKAASFNVNGIDGEDISAIKLRDSVFWTNSDNWVDTGWDSAVWEIKQDMLPILKNTNGLQMGVISTHIVDTVTSPLASVRLLQSVFDYNSEEQKPEVTVEFDGETLTFDKDYELAITSIDDTNTSAGTNAGTVTITITGKGKYAGTKTLNYEIKKINPTYIVPVGLTAVYGDTISDIALPIGWAWKSTMSLVGSVGHRTHKVFFTPTDTINYNTISDIDVLILVNKANPLYVIPNNLRATYGDALSTVELPTGWTWDNPETQVGNAGDQTHKATFTPLDTDNYNIINDKDIIISVGKANPLYIMPNNLFATYGNALSTTALPTGWTWVKPETLVGNAGDQTHKATFSPPDTANYNIFSNIDITITVNKANPIYDIPTGITAVFGHTLSEIDLPYGWDWSNATDFVGDVGNRSHKATFTPDDKNNFNIVEIDITVAVKALSGATVIPMLSAKTSNSITINSVISPANGQFTEYKISKSNQVPDGEWQMESVFKELDENTTYYIFVRAKSNDYNEAGTISVIEVKTDKKEKAPKGCGAATGFSEPPFTIVYFSIGLTLLMHCYKKFRNAHPTPETMI